MVLLFRKKIHHTRNSSTNQFLLTNMVIVPRNITTRLKNIDVQDIWRIKLKWLFFFFSQQSLSNAHNIIPEFLKQPIINFLHAWGLGTMILWKCKISQLRFYNNVGRVRRDAKLNKMAALLYLLSGRRGPKCTQSYHCWFINPIKSLCKGKINLNLTTTKGYWWPDLKVEIRILLK